MFISKIKLNNIYNKLKALELDSEIHKSGGFHNIYINGKSISLRKVIELLLNYLNVEIEITNPTIKIKQK